MTGVDLPPTWWSDLSDRYDRLRRDYIRHLNVLLVSLEEGPAPGRDASRWGVLAEGEKRLRDRLDDLRRVMNARLRDAIRSGASPPPTDTTKDDLDAEIRRLRDEVRARVAGRASAIRRELDDCRSAGRRRRAGNPSRRSPSPTQVDIRA